MYTKTGCPWCNDARGMLNERGVNFEEREVLSNDSFMEELVSKSAQNKTPTFDIDGEIFADSSAEEIGPVLSEKGII